MLPSSVRDYDDPMLAKIINTTQRAAKMSPEEKVKFLKAAWDAIGSNSARATRSMRCSMRARASSPPATATAPSTGAGATAMVDDLMSSYQLADELGTKQ